GHSQEQIAEDTRQALRVIDLPDEGSRPPLSLSFGQQKRVSIASVLAMRSSVLVMDEPTAGQDYAHFMQFMDAVVGLGATGAHSAPVSDEHPYDFDAIMFITHDVDLAVCYANRVILLGNHHVVADGTPVEVLSDFERLRRCRVLPTSLLQANL